MNEADRILVDQIRRKPWRELSLCGAVVMEKTTKGRRKKDPDIHTLQVELAWVEKGAMADEYNVGLRSDMEEPELLDFLNEIAAFARGAIPVAWGAQSKASLVGFLARLALREPAFVLDPDLCFLLRPKSRWLDPMIWARVRTGKFHPLDTILKSVGIVKSHSPAIDVAALAYQLPTREGFPVKPGWTASETADWQELQAVF